MVLKVLGIGSSPRKDGNSDILLQHFLETVASNVIDVEEIQLRDYQFQSCIGCERCRKDRQCTGLNDDMQYIYPKILEAGGLILVSPVHNYNITALMKAFIDRLYCFYEFHGERPGQWSSRLSGQGRKAIVAAIGEQFGVQEGMHLTLEAMRLPLAALGYEVIGTFPITGIYTKGMLAQHHSLLDISQVLAKLLSDSLKGNV
ncbi:MAG TPA: flavodoxin family protein [Dehalococcoidia bacterium]|nr:flavodoxin family protein [Dehalococcoidia bacterium]